MSDHCISSHAPLSLLDEEWENDLLSDDEDFVPFSHVSYAAPTQYISAPMHATTAAGATIMTQNANIATSTMAPISGLAESAEQSPLGAFGSPMEHHLDATPIQHHTEHQQISPSMERHTTTLSTPNGAMRENSRRRSLQALRSPASSPSSSAQQGGTSSGHSLPNSPASRRQQGGPSQQQSHAFSSAPHNPSSQISRSIDAFFNHAARNFTHSTVLMTQHRNKNANVALSRTGLVDLEPVSLPSTDAEETSQTIMAPQLAPPIYTRNGMATSTHTLDDHYSQRYYDTSYAASSGGMYSNYQITSSGATSGSASASHVPVALSEFEDDSFMLNSHGMTGGSGAGSQNTLNGNWNDIALDQLWQETLGGGASGVRTVR